MKPLLGPRSLRPGRINRDTRQEPVGAKVPEKKRIWDDLDYRYRCYCDSLSLETCEGDAVRAAFDPLFDAIITSPFDDVSALVAQVEALMLKPSSYWREAYAEVERRRAAEKPKPHQWCADGSHTMSPSADACATCGMTGVETRVREKRLDMSAFDLQCSECGCELGDDELKMIGNDRPGQVFCGPVCLGQRPYRAMLAKAAFAELGRIVGSHPYDGRLQGSTSSGMLFGLDRGDSYMTGITAWSNSWNGALSLRDAMLQGYAKWGILSAEDLAAQKPKPESRLDYLRRELRENTTLSVGECDLLANSMFYAEKNIGRLEGWGPPSAIRHIGMCLHGTMGESRWTYRDRNGAERRIAIPGRGE